LMSAGSCFTSIMIALCEGKPVRRDKNPKRKYQGKDQVRTPLR
jgi:hypothetical protein